MPQPFNNAVMTNGGAALLTKAQAGECKIEFTKMAIGDGTYSESEETVEALQQRTGLKSQKNSYQVTQCSVYTEKSVKITAILSNYDPSTMESLVDAGYYINEIGLFAKEKDGSASTEVLYSIATTAGAEGDFMPAYNGYNPAQITQEYYATVDNSAEVYVDVSGVFLTEEEADKLYVTIDDALAYMIGVMPYYYEREELMIPNKTEITIPANTQVNINGGGYCSVSDTVLSTKDVAGAGVDVYVYACVGSTPKVPEFVLSRNSTVPDGYTADNSRKIGGFHCLCADVGTISGHALSGYEAGDILPASVWDLKHRPVSEPEGMVYDEGTGRWYDIYLPSWDGEKLVSVFGGVPVTGTSATPMHGLMFKEKLGTEGKRLLWRHEFMCVAGGSNQRTAIKGEANPGDTGGHTDTAGRRMISDIGLEDCCGAFYQWVNDEYEALIYASTNSQAGTVSTSTGVISRYYTGNNDTENKYFSGYNWSVGEGPNANTPPATYNDQIDDEIMGDSYGLPRQALVGGAWSPSSHCGSRCVNALSFGSRANESSAARGASEPRVA